MTILPEFIDPWRASEQGMRINGTVDDTQLNRVPGLLSKPAGTVQFGLEFFRDMQKRHCVRGKIKGSLWLVCQRCLEPVEVRINVAMTLALVRKYEDVELLPDQYESLVVTTAQIRPLDLVEDEIILVLPYIPLHQNEDVCRIRSAGADKVVETPFQPEEEEHPFQMLEQLKHRLH